MEEVPMAKVGTGTIGAGSGENFVVELTAGRPHRVFVHPDDPTADFDLQVFDENGNLITQDISTSSEAYCVITPRWTGPFTLSVTAASGASTYQIVVED
jgi:hypothetical protein